MTKRRVQHGAMPVCGFIEPWSVSPGETALIHLSSRDPNPSISVISFDEEINSASQAGWTIDKLENDVRVQDIFQGSWLEITIPSHRLVNIYSLEIELEFLLTFNPTPRVLICIGQIFIVVFNNELQLRFIDSVKYTADIVRTDAWNKINVIIRDDFVNLIVTGPDSKFTLSSPCSSGLNVSSVRIGSSNTENDLTANARYARPKIKIDDVEVASWLFPPGPPVGTLKSSTGVWDDLKIHGAPTFGVSSSRWRGAVHDPRLDACQYDALHCHDTDFSPLGWAATHSVSAPHNAKSGIYGIDVQTEYGSERIPFFLRSGEPQARIAFLVPTLTYLAYADEALPSELYEWRCNDRGHRFAQENRLCSLYDRHSDGSGVMITTTRRPKATLREDYRYPLSDCPHLFPVDLQLLRFCRSEGIEFDLITDHDLHCGGSRVILPYDGIFTGSHPEYWTAPMHDALAEFLEAGRSLAYLGGNGFMWVSAVEGDAMEVRRGQGLGARTWDGKPGEINLSLTGEIGGMWRERGRSEFSVVGTGMSMMGFSPGRPYRRNPASYAPGYSWIFDGVTSDNFGSTGSVLGAAAGYEVDRRNHALGTHPDTIALAAATGFDTDYATDPNEFFATPDDREQARISEMVIRFTPQGGFIFGVGSVAWCGSLPEAGQTNDIGTITANILRRMQK